jgi:hypothetical protein
MLLFGASPYSDWTKPELSSLAETAVSISSCSGAIKVIRGDPFILPPSEANNADACFLNCRLTLN